MPDHATDSPQSPPLLIVTGMSGAGKSSALKALEDIGFDAVDNLPLSLLGDLVNILRRPGLRLAIGIDVRTREFTLKSLNHEIAEMRRRDDLSVQLLFLDCEDDVLRRRFDETRRRHPLAIDRSVSDGIAHERSLIMPLRDAADMVIDTSRFQLGDLQQALEGYFSLDTAPGLSLFLTSFAYREGLPREADLVFDVRFLANPHYQSELKDLTGLDERVGAYIETDPDFAGFFDSLTGMLDRLVPRYRAEGKSYLTIAVGCTGGRHRSVYVVERLAEFLRPGDTRLSIRHREIARDPGRFEA